VSNAKEIPERNIAMKEFTVLFYMKAGRYQLGTKSYLAQREGMAVFICL